MKYCHSEAHVGCGAIGGGGSGGGVGIGGGGEVEVVVLEVVAEVVVLDGEISSCPGTRRA